MAVTVRLLGAFTIETGETSVPAEAWTRRQAAALVKLLASTPGQELHREQVIDALWPDLSLDEAAPRLHKAAHFARKVLGEAGSIALRGDVIALYPDRALTVDAFEFDELARDALDKGTIEAAERALALYGGDLLPHDLYEPWTEALRERLRLRYLQLLRQAERWEDLLVADPTDEDAHLGLMRSNAEAGNRRAALLQFERMERVLERELGLEPSAAAIALREQLVAAEPGTAARLPSPVLAEPAAPVASPFVSVPVERAPGSSWPLIGRAAELERVAAGFSDSERGGVLVCGGAGVGKTRLAEECLRAARAAGLTTARVAGHPEAHDLTFAGFAHLLPPEVVSGSAGELDRAALFHRARVAITRGVPPGERLLLHVDDVDHLDELSRTLLTSLVMERTVFAILTLRSGGTALPAIEHLVKDGHLDRIELLELDTDAAETLLYRALGGPVLRDAQSRLIDASLGNPGILRQLVESARERGTLSRANGVWQLTGPLETTPTLEGLVSERLDGLTSDERRVLELLAVAGELGLQVLVELTSEAAVEGTEVRGILSVREDGRRTNVGLVHPLFGEVTRGRLSALGARRLRRELADAVEAHGARRIDDRFRIVAWRLDGGGEVSTPMLVSAARLALIAGRTDIAARLLERLDREERSPEILQLRAELHFRRGEPRQVEQLLESIDPTEVDDQRRAQIARRRAYALFYESTHTDASEAVLRRAMTEVTDPAIRQGLEATLAMMLATSGHVGRAVTLAETALPRATGATRLELLRVLSLSLSFAGRTDDAIELAQEGLALRDSLDADVLLPGRSMFYFSEIVARTENGQIDEARRISDHVRRTTDRPGVVGWLDTAHARLELLAGRPRSARRVVRARLNEARVEGRGATERWVLALHACGRLLEGDIGRAAEDLTRVAALEDGTRALLHVDIDRAHAFLAVTTGRADEARAKLLAAADEARARGASGIEVILLHDMLRFGLADEVLDRLAGEAQGTQGALNAARALHARGHLEGDPALIDTAAAAFSETGADLLAAEAAADAARLFEAQGRGPEATAAAGFSDELRRRSGVRLVSPALVGALTPEC